MGFTTADPFSEDPAIGEEVHLLIFFIHLAFFPPKTLFTSAAAVISGVEL